MSNLRTTFNEALTLIDGQHYFVATITPRSYFEAADARRPILKAGALVKRGDQQAESCTVLATPSIHRRLQQHLRMSRPVELALQYEGQDLRILGLPPQNKQVAA